MLRFECDYTEGCIPEILEAIQKENHTQLQGYSEDPICDRARARVKALCGREDVDVHFLVGGTQTNTTVIASGLRPFQGVIAAAQGHIACHETGAIEATGHKVLALPSATGRLSASQIRACCAAHWNDATHEHQVQPAMVYLSHPAENGTLYTLEELKDIRKACDEWNLTLFVDGARLGYGLEAKGNDVTLPDLARLCDVFYIGGTKVGALFGEAVVISNPALKEDFRYLIKQHGGMLAKGRLLGVQFEALLEGDLYFEISRHADGLADKIRQCLQRNHVPMYVENETNQIFPILPDAVLAQLQKTYVFTEQCRVDDAHRAVRICTSWATGDENVDRLCRDLDALLKAE